MVCRLLLGGKINLRRNIYVPMYTNFQFYKHLKSVWRCKIEFESNLFFFRFSFVVVVNAQVKRLSMGSIQSYLFFFSLSHSFHSFAFLSVIFWKQTLSVYFLFLLQHHVFFFWLLFIVDFDLLSTTYIMSRSRDER